MRNFKFVGIFVLSFLITAAASGTLFAQDSSLTGSVTDPTGAIVPGAEITLISSTGGQRMVISDDQGRYLFAQVRPGTYNLRAELPGFKTTEVANVVLEIDLLLRLDLSLELGEVTQIVTVTSQAVVLVNKTDASVGNAFNSDQIQNIPLNARNTVNLLTLQPGVTAQGEVSGARRDQSNMMLDGIDVNDQQTAASQPGLDQAQPGSPREFQPVLRVTPASIQEFRVTVSNPSASQGRSAGAQVSLVTRSGTNDWHGSLYHAYRGTVTTANTFFNNRVGIDRPTLVRNLFGGSVGGPIVSDRAFFFFNYEGRRDRSQQSVIRTVPLPHLGNGEVKYISSVTGETVTLTPAEIAAAYPALGGINPASVAVLKDAAARFPANDSGAGDQINSDGFRFNASTPLNQNTYIAKLDFNLSDQHTVFVRGNYQWDNQAQASRFPDSPSPSVWSHPTGLAVGHTWSASPTVTNTFRYGVTRQAFSQLGDQAENFINFRFVYQNRIGSNDLTRVTPMHNVTNDTSWIRGDHTLQFGTNMRFIDNTRNSFGNAFDSASNNPFGIVVNSLQAPFDDISGGSETPFLGGMAAVLGRYSNYTANFTFSGDGKLLSPGTGAARTFATEEFDFYFEDNWQISSSLSINFGLRYGINTVVNETTGFQVAPTFGLGQFLDARLASAAKGIPLNTSLEIDTSGPFYNKPPLYEQDKNNWAPRISAAWSPSFEGGVLRKLFGANGESVFRGGFAMVYDRVGSQLAVTFDNRNSLGFTSNTAVPVNTYNATTSPGPLFTGYDQDIRTLPLIDIPGDLEFPLTKPRDNGRRIEAALDSNLVTPVNYTWNFSMGRELPGGLFVEASYLGRRANDLYATHDVVHPNNLFDPASGTDYYDTVRLLLDARKGGISCTGEVGGCEGLPTIPWIENILPGLGQQGEWWTGPASYTPSQNAYYWVARDGHDIVDWTFFQDVHNQSGAVADLFFHPQYAAFMAFGSLAKSNYHAFSFSARERFSDSLSIDLNYTWSKSFDNASGLQSASPTGGAALIRNPITPEIERGLSDFNTKHIINANWLWDVPVGVSRKFGSGMPGILDAIVGGWAMNGVFRWNSGRPIGGPFESGRWNTNWQISNNLMRIRDPKADPHKGGDQPNFWADPQFAYNSFRDTYAGEVGDRNVYNRSGYFVLDLGIQKEFTLPYSEDHKITFAWEVFNVTNTQALGGPSTNGVGVDPEISEKRTNFGQITGIQGQPRVMQFALRFDF